MEMIEKLSDEAENMGISLHDEQLEYIDALYLDIDGQEHISLRHDGTSVERTCWLAEELGHHHFKPNRVLQYDCVDDWRAESRARKWAHNRLLSVDAIRTAAQNTTDIYELAEALGVTEQFLREAVDDYQRRGLWAI